MTSIAAGVCVFAVSGARAQVTNAVTISVTTFNQGPTNTTSNGTSTTTTYGPTKTKAYNTAAVVEEIGKAIGVTFTSPKLVLITGNNGATFAVIDGANTYDLSSNGVNVLNITFSIPAQIKSGSQVSTGQQKLTQSIPINIVYDDTVSSTGNQLTFTLSGLVTFTETKTAPVSLTFTDTEKGKFTGSGGGTSQGNPFTATGTISFSGSAKLTVLT